MKQCPACRGTGEEWYDTGWHRGEATGHWGLCLTCDGAGRVPEMDEEE